MKNLKVSDTKEEEKMGLFSKIAPSDRSKLTDIQFKLGKDEGKVTHSTLEHAISVCIRTMHDKLFSPHAA